MHPDRSNAGPARDRVREVRQAARRAVASDIAVVQAAADAAASDAAAAQGDATQALADAVAAQATADQALADAADAQAAAATKVEVWGDIGGTMSDQTDLQAALDFFLGQVLVTLPAVDTALAAAQEKLTLQAPGSFTLATTQFRVHGKRLELTGAQRATLVGNARLCLVA